MVPERAGKPPEGIGREASADARAA